MMDAILAWPLSVAIPVLWTIAMLRSNATYWLARGTVVGTHRIKHRDEPFRAPRRGVVLINRYGPWAVAFCFFTIGLQTAILLAAGASRMSQSRFLPAVAIGSVFWAVLYATVGLAIVQAYLLGLAGSWWAMALVVVAIAAVVAFVWYQRRRVHHADTLMGPTEPAPAESSAEPTSAA